jgi:hydrogenase expression/formation protein HypC
MCLATPIRITKIDGLRATVTHSEKEYNVSLQLIPKAKVGDWILAHGEIAINIIPEEEAKNILALIEKADGHACSCP